jgi:hypothetical protein
MTCSPRATRTRQRWQTPCCAVQPPPCRCKGGAGKSGARAAHIHVASRWRQVPAATGAAVVHRCPLPADAGRRESRAQAALDGRAVCSRDALAAAEAAVVRCCPPPAGAGKGRAARDKLVSHSRDARDNACPSQSHCASSDRRSAVARSSHSRRRQGSARAERELHATCRPRAIATRQQRQELRWHTAAPSPSGRWGGRVRGATCLHCAIVTRRQ